MPNVVTPGVRHAGRRCGAAPGDSLVSVPPARRHRLAAQPAARAAEIAHPALPNPARPEVGRPATPAVPCRADASVRRRRQGRIPRCRQPCPTQLPCRHDRACRRSRVSHRRSPVSSRLPRMSRHSASTPAFRGPMQRMEAPAAHAEPLASRMFLCRRNACKRLPLALLRPVEHVSAPPRFEAPAPRAVAAGSACRATAASDHACRRTACRHVPRRHTKNGQTSDEAGSAGTTVPKSQVRRWSMRP